MKPANFAYLLRWVCCRAVLGLCAALVLALTQPATAQTTISDVLPEDLQRTVEQSSGRLIVQLSSADRNCGFCVRSNPRFEELARNHPDAGKYIRTFWHPWDKVFESPLPQKLRVLGIPAYFVFEDGRLVNRVDGDHPVADLSVKLLSQSRPQGSVPKDLRDIEDVSPAQIQDMLDFQQNLFVVFTSSAPECKHCAVGEQSIRAAYLAAKGKYPDVVARRVVFSSLEEAQADPLVRQLKLEGLPAIVCFRQGLDRSARSSLIGGRFVGNVRPGSGFFQCTTDSSFVHIDHRKQYSPLVLN
jgi:thiol-disulfide isomerase/thioredoxin